MANCDFDLIVVGGGLGGAALAKRVADRGVRVLVVERESEFRDRVRGEALVPWGAAEAASIGLYDILLEHGAFEKPFFNFVGFPVRDLRTTTLQGMPYLNLYHPAMQAGVIEAAKRSGAIVWCGTAVREIKPGNPPAITVQREGGIKRFTARMVVGADGRSSMCRNWGRFEVIRGANGMLLAGILFDGIRTAEDTSVMVVNSEIGQAAYLFPQHGARVRAYCALPLASGRHLQGAADIGNFIHECTRSGIPAETYTEAKPIGPLATFDSTANWVEEVYRDGIALVGDAAGTSDPVWGQGLSLTLRDASVLSEQLLCTSDWDAAGRMYAQEHQRYFGATHTVEEWFSKLFLWTGSKADTTRAKALPLLLADPTRIPDHIFSGPELPFDEHVRRRFFGDE